jgi:hypothetical protein
MASILGTNFRNMKASISILYNKTYSIIEKEFTDKKHLDSFVGVLIDKGYNVISIEPFGVEETDSDKMEIKGKVIAVLAKKTGISKAGKKWTSQEFVIEAGDQYLKKVCLGLFGDKISCPQIDDVVTVSFDVSSTEYNGSWYTKLNVWKIEGATAQPAQNQTPPAPDPLPEDEGTGLPF